MSLECRRVCIAGGIRGALFLAFIGYCIILLHQRSAHLFIGFDGSYVLDLARRELSLDLPLTVLSGNFYSGLGDIVYPSNFQLFPSFLGLGAVPDLAWAKAICFGVTLAELFLATYFLARTIEFNRALSIASAMVVGILLFPFAGIGFVVSLVPLVPQTGTATAVSLGIAGAFIRFGRLGFRRDWPWAALFLLLLLWCLLASITVLVIASGFLVLTTLAALAAAPRREWFPKLGLLLVAAIVFFGLGPVQFLLGVVLDSAPAFFSRELEDNVSSLAAVSILFNVLAYGISAPVLMAAAACGAAWSAWRGQGVQRTFAIALLSFFVLLAAVAAIMMGSTWRGPAPLYLEMFFVPLYVIFALNLLQRLSGLLFGRIRWPKLPQAVPEAAVAVAGVAVVTAIAGLWPVNSYGWVYPPKHTPITQILTSEISMRPGDPFRGRVVTLTGRSMAGKAVSWLDLHGQDGERLAETGNDHRITGLNYFRIPVLFPYGPVISPAFYAATSRLLMEPGDLPMRNVVVLRRIEPRILRLFGVRYVITDVPDESLAGLRSQIQVGKTGQLYLYELPDVNVGQFAPTKVKVVATAQEIVTRLRDKDFDPRSQVIVDRAIGVTSVTPPREASLVFDGSGMRYRATSDGQSLAVLPIEFSRCMVVEQTSGLPVTIVRANLALVGIVFSKAIDVRLSTQIGPFANAGCRLTDRREMIELGLRELAH